jgi:putative ABC transport system substrate-binding protein
MQRTTRRRFLLGAGALAAAPLARAQKPASMATLGFLSHESPLTPEQILKSPFTARLKSLGWEHGRNLRIEAGFASGQAERYPELAAGLVTKKVDVIWAVSPPAAVAAARATRSIPVVFARVVWPVELGLAQSLARPGGNVTGVASVADPRILAKPAEYLREIAPSATRMTMILPRSTMYKTVSGGEFSPQRDSTLLQRIEQVGFRATRVYAGNMKELEEALRDALDARAEALFVTSSPLLYAQRKHIADFALRHRLPSAFIESPFVSAGGLLSYGSSVWGSIFQSLDYVDRILRGAKPAELPIQLPTQMELVINRRTANLLGLAIPQPLLLRADRVIE